MVKGFPEFCIWIKNTMPDITSDVHVEAARIQQQIKAYLGLRTSDLNKMWTYVQNFKEKDNSYTIQWVAGSDHELHTSYFRASNIFNALEKLYYGRDRNMITVFSVVLNPVS